ncbi:DUF3568 family protein [Allofrancisella guangzhouensis]|uniref:DUF3568 family protein n=1 Tax=Allofrancisella guangzhouensis TaxID=594679 RepID=A0A0A8E2V0_9GAMM|nr:DUF3568 family protein [Allofrancisella guangzhouensis]AJC48520.1 hypothetical protein SD28_02060 [Allofrancisella guangzhouensis]MBK2027820.1 DUF3568 family protein [Allofrancisella guangzhouensis]MBK2044810.1 DUF3568 family protein [Allofrancisella guangzhouensis]MBK2045738.1 DUF3568 family protein [Allofrancisella guangzhouensis]
MKNMKILTLCLITALVLSACSNNSSLAEDLNSTSKSVVNFINGIFSAEIDNTSVQSVYNATKLALNNNGNYDIKKSDIKDGYAEISGIVKSNKDPFEIKMIKSNNDIINMYIKIGTFGDKQASVNLLSDVRNILGL